MVGPQYSLNLFMATLCYPSCFVSIYILQYLIGVPFGCIGEVRPLTIVGIPHPTVTLLYAYATELYASTDKVCFPIILISGVCASQRAYSV